MAGLTLLELLVVLSLSACLSAVGSSIYSQMLSRSQLIALTNELAGLMKDAQQWSVRTNKNYYFDMHIGGSNRCWSIATQRDCHCSDNTVSSCALQFSVLSPQYHNINITSNREQLIFTPLFGYSNAGSYKLSIATDATRIVISSLGRIRICTDLGDIQLYAAC